MDYYSILGVQKNATEEEVRQAHRKLAFANHPDRGGNVEVFKKIQIAYESLLKKGVFGKQADKPKHDSFKIYDNMAPKFDLWGKPLTVNQQKEWHLNNVLPMKEVVKNKQPIKNKSEFFDIFKNHYESNESVELR